MRDAAAHPAPAVLAGWQALQRLFEAADLIPAREVETKFGGSASATDAAASRGSCLPRMVVGVRESGSVVGI